MYFFCLISMFGRPAKPCTIPKLLTYETNTIISPNLIHDLIDPPEYATRPLFMNKKEQSMPDDMQVVYEILKEKVKKAIDRLDKFEYDYKKDPITAIQKYTSKGSSVQTLDASVFE